MNQQYFSSSIFNIIVVVVVVAAIGMRVVEIGATCGSPGHHGIEARRRLLLFCTMGA